jgi:hypothetical protein
MDQNIVLVFTGLLGTVVGGFIAVIGGIIRDKQRKRFDLYKLLIQKRIEAYESLVPKIEFFGMGLIESDDYSSPRYPLILENPEKLFDWRIQNITMMLKQSHLIGLQLGEELHFLEEYIIRLEPSIKKCRLQNGDFDLARIRRIGYIVYPDFQLLKQRNLHAICDYFSRGIYESKFKPYIGERYQRKTLPVFFSKLALFTREEDIKKIASQNAI